MNYRMMGRFLSEILLVEVVFMLPALCISLFCREFHAAKAFLLTVLIELAIASGMYAVCRKAKKDFYAREGFVCVGLSWMAISLLGSLPFILSGEIPNFIDAFFEMVSGFTTTGASVLPEVESLSKGILYWRSFSNWLGGMGVLVFLLAVVPLGRGSNGFTLYLLRAESPGPTVGKLVPRMRQTAGILYLIYILLTIINLIFLLAGGMSLFEAVCTAFTTAGTGGFGVRNDSLASYSPYLQNVCTVFMLIFGVNFTCYYMLLIRKVKSVLKDEELHLYLGIVFSSIVLIVWNLRGYYDTLGETVRHAAFQVSSIVTTTGFATTDFDQWPSFSKAILLCLMLAGACAGSTAGGFKCGRLLLLIKNLRRNCRQILNPQRVQVVRNNGHAVGEQTLDNINAYLAAYVIIIVFSVVIVSLDGFSVTTNISAVLSCFNNIGPGLEAVGPTCNYGAFSILSKLVLIADMLAGRLEIFPILILASRSTWHVKSRKSILRKDSKQHIRIQ